MCDGVSVKNLYAADGKIGPAMDVDNFDPTRVSTTMGS